MHEILGNGQCAMGGNAVADPNVNCDGEIKIAKGKELKIKNCEGEKVRDKKLRRRKLKMKIHDGSEISGSHLSPFSVSRDILKSKQSPQIVI